MPAQMGCLGRRFEQFAADRPAARRDEYFAGAFALLRLFGGAWGGDEAGIVQQFCRVRGQRPTRLERQNLRIGVNQHAVIIVGKPGLGLGGLGGA